MTVADTAAVKTLAESVNAGAFVGHVYTTLVPKVLTNWSGSSPATGYPYIILHPAEGTDEATRSTGATDTTNPEFTFHIVGLTAASVQTVTAALKAILKPGGKFALNPTVTGRRNYNAYWRSPIPLQTDRDVTPWLVYAVVEYGWVSDPTS